MRRAVPARDPLMPMFARTAIAALVSRIDSPAAAACGPPIFNASKRSISVWAELFAVTVRTSATSLICDASMPKIRMLFAAMSPASASSVPVDRARFSTASMDAWISVGENPIRPSDTIASAACCAV